MRDYTHIRGLNPKKTPVQPLAQYCAMADIAEAEIKKQRKPLQAALESFLAEKLMAEELPEPSPTVSELLYVGLESARDPRLHTPIHEEAEDFLQEALRQLLRKLCRLGFDRGLQAGFSGPGEMADRLREDISYPAWARLELFFPADFWQLPLSVLLSRERKRREALGEAAAPAPTDVAFRFETTRQEARALSARYEESIRAGREAAQAETKSKNRERNQRRKRSAAIRTAIVNTIPDNYIDLFPLARAMERHFVLHIGPTNSGKTHDAIEALKQAENGIYLGPLRLLAFEQFENLNEAGYPCSLVTGEERIEVPYAYYQASTVEMLNTKNEYALAVIDEAQMIGDPDRGGAWTKAILGVCAKEVHVCAAPIAQKLLIRLIRDCGDSYTVVRHRRMTPLNVEEAPFDLAESVEKGDALIVFSKKSVHGVGSYLQKKGYTCSVIYGALPYDVRREQARLFAGGLTDVVVATDAIGMGMNLPIRRVVFLEQEKFDGISVRELNTEEIKQIAGRAGRYGIYPEGLVSSVEGRDRIRAALNGKSERVSEAVIAFPESLLGVEATLSEIIERWAQIEIKPGYTRADPSRMLKLCRLIEPLSEDKHFLYDCISMTFDEEEPQLLSRWRVMCAKEAAGECYEVEAALPEEKWIRDQDNMNELEEAFRLCDLLYGYCEKLGHTEFRETIMRHKNRISARMTAILAQQSLKGKKCANCGRALPWNAPYKLCERCFRRRRERKGEGLLRQWKEK